MRFTKALAFAAALLLASVPQVASRTAIRKEVLRVTKLSDAIIDPPSKLTTRLGGAPDISPQKKATILMGLLMAFNSGFVNGICLSGAATANGSKQAVAAVTASWTNSAMGLASGNNGQFKFLSQVILSFMSGSAIAGYLTPRPKQFVLEGSPYATSFYAGAILLVLAGMKIGEMESVKTGFLLAAMANGIQNSVTSTLTGNLCRSSHFTGITSEMGTFIGQILRGNKENMFKLQVFAGLAACFWLGGFTSFGAAKEFGNSALYISAGLYVLVGSLYSNVPKML
jgi:hypothetical protein